MKTNRLPKGKSQSSDDQHQLTYISDDGSTKDMGPVQSHADALRMALDQAPNVGMIEPADSFIGRLASQYGQKAAHAMLRRAMEERKVLPTYVLINGKSTPAVALTPAFLQDVREAAEQGGS